MHVKCFCAKVHIFTAEKLPGNKTFSTWINDLLVPCRSLMLSKNIFKSFSACNTIDTSEQNIAHREWGANMSIIIISTKSSAGSNTCQHDLSRNAPRCPTNKGKGNKMVFKLKWMYHKLQNAKEVWVQSIRWDRILVLRPTLCHRTKT